MASMLLDIIFKCVLVVACLTAHELGHIVVARICGVSVKKVGIRWTGAYVQRARTTGWPEVAICMAGATTNLVLALAFWDVNEWFALCNLVLGVVNLLPIAHSDGSHALEALESMRVPRM